MNNAVFNGCMPALMTPCTAQRQPDYEALVAKGRELVELGMSAVVYCGSMGDWPLLSAAQRQQGVARLVAAGVPTIVGTGAVNSAEAVSHARHAAEVGAHGLMVIPRVLSRGSSAEAQAAHFSAILDAAPALPAVIYNSPVYGFATRAELFFALRQKHRNLVGFKEFGGAADLRYAAEHITSGHDDIALMVGVDTQVVHGFVNCNASGAITGIGNALPKAVLRLVSLSRAAAAGDVRARRLALELEAALGVLSSFDEGADLVLYYKHLMVLNGEQNYRLHFNPGDALGESQRRYLETQYALFRTWYAQWPGNPESSAAGQPQQV
ncbi:dihydrodipicolinate synthase family protein [Kushneria aurantia]|uniref:Dihydrodipicolinate synthase family protein n=1 Tax=Kushneria aurantia TaxID=504092 RepID=A0ABV6G1R2_9GAMM|nr:dihydrodipicolinate synthase family protein [Kushneria aurantia]